MFGRVTNFLEAIDERVEQLADEQGARDAEEEEHRLSEELRQQQAQAERAQWPTSDRSTRFPSSVLSSSLAPARGVGVGEAATLRRASRLSQPAASVARSVPSAASPPGSTRSGRSPQPQQLQQPSPAEEAAVSGAASARSEALSSSGTGVHREGVAGGGRSAGLSSALGGGGNAATARPASPATAGFGAGLSLESLRLRCAALQQAVEGLEEELELAHSQLQEKSDAAETAEERCATADAEKARWQREATYFKDIATTSRDALLKRESELRVLQQSQQDIVQELAAHRASSRSLLEAKEAEVLSLKAKLLRQGDEPASSASGEAASGVSAAQERIHTLEAEVSALLARQREGEEEVEHLRRESAAALREREKAQQLQQDLQQHVDGLKLDIRALEESMEGETLARKEVQEQLRQAREELQQAALDGDTPYALSASASNRPRRDGKEEVDGGASSTVDVARLEDALADAQQRAQMMSFQLLERQAAAEAAAREVAEWRVRYNAIARRVGDDEIAAAAGYGYNKISTSSTKSAFPQPPTIGAHHTSSSSNSNNTEVAVRVSGGGGGGGASSGSAGPVAAVSDLRRNPSMVLLARRGRVVRVVIDALAKVDDCAVRAAHYLRARPLARVALESYVCLLQIWVILVFLLNLAMAGDEELQAEVLIAASQ